MARQRLDEESKADLGRVETLPREKFIEDHFDYKPGEHLSIIGPTQRGKTTLGLQLLHATATPELRGVVLASKPRDVTVDRWLKQRRFRVVEEWGPPAEWPWEKKKIRGYVVRPHQTLHNVREDNAEVRKQFENAIYDSYATKQKRIVVVDEAHEVQDELKLKQECEMILKRGASLDCGGWFFLQRTAYNSYDMYNAPEHLFLFNDPDRRNRQRFGEIGGGVNPDMVEYLTNNLSQYQVLYIKRTGPEGPYLCIVNP